MADRNQKLTRMRVW